MIAVDMVATMWIQMAMVFATTTMPITDQEPVRGIVQVPEQAVAAVQLRVAVLLRAMVQGSGITVRITDNFDHARSGIASRSPRLIWEL